MAKASIGIFPHKFEYTDNSTCPRTPPEVFEAAQHVIETKGSEIVRTPQGLYFVQYSETGPGKQAQGWSDWLPVYIARVQVWTAGGIRQTELEAYLKEKKDENNPSDSN